MVLEQNIQSLKSEVIREGGESFLRFDCSDLNIVPSVEDNPLLMARVINDLAGAGVITKIVFVQKKDYEYDTDQANLLKEIGDLFNKFVSHKSSFSFYAFGTEPQYNSFYSRWYNDVQFVIFSLMKSDPIGAYVEIKRLLRHEKLHLEKVSDEKFVPILKKYISILVWFIANFEQTKLIQLSQPHLAGYKVGDRSVYRQIFRPSIKPDFMYTKLMASYPVDGEEIASYIVGRDTEVAVFQNPETVEYLYHMMPPEFKLSEDKYEILDMARRVMAEHKPTKEEFVDPQRMRDVFSHVGFDLIEELATYKNVKMPRKDMKELTDILIRYTVGFGLIEVLLQDENIQDVSINSPLGRIPMFIVHSEFADCKTNIIPTIPEAESWASKLRMISGRPLDEAHPILDTELTLPGARTRVSTITEPLNPSGIAFSFRRHRNRPWTLPLFIHHKAINPISAGIWSFMIDGNKTMLIAGTRSSGKSSLLAAVLVEMMRRYRILTIEDTLELPTDALREMGYNIQPMKVASAFAKESGEMNAADGIRATLRLGDSALIIGEVRSKEAIALYEAMRVGAAANVVAGTIHGDSPYGLFDRVVNDLGVPKTSFKATDVIIIANPIRSPDGLHRWRRVTQFTEVRKFWQDDPLAENGFVDLLKYNPSTDELEPTPDLINGDSDVLKAVGGNVKEWAGNWDALWDNIMLRAKIKGSITEYAHKSSNLELLEAPFVIRCNDMFHKVSEAVKNEVGFLDSKRIFEEWDTWIKRAIKKEAIEQAAKKK
jgi:type IV secretory pathway ATPase VirB11/archaellum biosynthesis ATPase